MTDTFIDEALEKLRNLRMERDRLKLELEERNAELEGAKQTIFSLRCRLGGWAYAKAREAQDEAQVPTAGP